MIINELDVMKIWQTTEKWLDSEMAKSLNHKI